jgi:hypothetical protein
LHPMDFTKEDYPLRYALNHEVILSSLHLRVKSADFPTFFDISRQKNSTVWKDMLKKISKLNRTDY